MLEHSVEHLQQRVASGALDVSAVGADCDVEDRADGLCFGKSVKLSWAQATRALHDALDCLAVGACRRSEVRTHNDARCRTVDVFAESECKVNRHLHEAVAMSAKVLRGGDRQQCPNDRQLHVRIRVLAAPGHDAYHLQGSSARLVRRFNGINRDAV